MRVRKRGTFGPWEGRSVNEIAARVGVPQSSVSIWVRTVELSGEQREA